MKWTIIIDSKEDDYQQNLKRHVHATDMAATLWDFDQWLRDRIKYDKEQPDAQAIRNQLHEIMNEHGIDLEDILY